MAGKRDRCRIAVTGEGVDLRATGKRQAEKARRLIEGFAGGVVARPRDDAHLERTLDADELGMTAGDE